MMSDPPTAPPNAPGGSAPDGARGGVGAVLFLAGAAFCVTPWASPQVGLGIGVALGLLGLARFGGLAKRWSRVLIQVAVVLLGFRMDLGQVWKTGAPGLLFAAGTIVGTFALGAGLARVLRTDGRITTLISSGTAICGGSAIAAVGAAIAASAAEMAVATGTVFLLNGAALYLFPALGHAMGLSAEQFGAWAGVAIHDVSSVVGAAQSFDAWGGGTGHGAEATATVVKLARVLWIVPIAAAAAWVHRRGEGRAAGEPRRWRSPVPWFIVLFLAASAVRTLAPRLGIEEELAGMEGWIKAAARIGMTLALFLIGSTLTRKAVAAVGWRALALGVCLWVFISVVSLIVVRATVA